MVSRKAAGAIKKDWESVQILFLTLSPVPSLFFLYLFNLHKY